MINLRAYKKFIHISIKLNVCANILSKTEEYYFIRKYIFNAISSFVNQDLFVWESIHVL